MVKEIDILQAARWIVLAWEQVKDITFKTWFVKVGITQDLIEENTDLDDEFIDMYEQIAEEIGGNMTPSEYAEFDADTVFTTCCKHKKCQLEERAANIMFGHS